MMSLVSDLIEYRRTRLWLMENIERIRDSFRGNYIAVLGRKVVDNDSDKYSLISRLWSRGMLPGPVVIEYVC
ncbi:MAG: hypothetical protein QXV05_01235 [Candidatus Korarchaeum sp.]